MQAGAGGEPVLFSSPHPCHPRSVVESFVLHLKRRVTALEEENGKLKKQLEVDRLIVKKELIVSDTGLPWEKGFEAHQIPRGIYAKSLAQ